MKPPRRRQTPQFARAIQPEPFSIPSLAERSPWAGPMVAGRPSLVNWRTMLSLLMRDVPIEPVATRIWPTLEAMAAQVLERVGEGPVEATGSAIETTYFDWLSIWCEHFQHWNDPIRMLVAEYCADGDAAIVAQHFPLFNGLAFADFVIEAISLHDERRMWHARMNEQEPPAPFLPLPASRISGDRTMDRICRQLYSDFQQRVPSATGSAPRDHTLGPFVAYIYADSTERMVPLQAVLGESHR